MEALGVEFVMLGFACFIVGALAGAVTTLILAAIVAGSRADDRLEEWHRNRKEKV
jgi:hypothetical protein